jgi:hypothetical protein
MHHSSRHRQHNAGKAAGIWKRVAISLQRATPLTHCNARLPLSSLQSNRSKGTIHSKPKGDADHHVQHSTNSNCPAVTHLRPFLSSILDAGVTAPLSLSRRRCSSGNRCVQMQSWSSDSSLVDSCVLLAPVRKDSPANLQMQHAQRSLN